MNTLRNQVQLIGRLGQDIEVNGANNGNKFAKLSIATNEYYKNKQGEKIENTTWHNCVAWGKTAELMDKICEKGNKIALRGKLTNHSYEDKEGIKRFVTEVQIEEFELM
ncbi:single-stranded DNA-binding protein [Mesonia sp. K7]|uniref:single-stranded DNA-binding protein n=1 Tax=Mesonia sp. K7 TaxID=2218606 RepID=UPI000DA9344B|nr:single-stranded DNA-binding protein [Mesonia sp. K7]PZD79439.1 single-stranded DNA-binding protein [Mesonia sp. K7]